MSNKKKVSIEVLNEDYILKEKGTLKDAPEPIFCSHYLLYDPDEVDLTKCNNLATTKMECCGNDVCDKCKTDFALKCAVKECDYYKEYNDDGSDESFWINENMQNMQSNHKSKHPVKSVHKHKNTSDQ